MAFEKRKRLWLIETEVYQAPSPKGLKGNEAGKKKALARIKKLQKRTAEYAAREKIFMKTIKIEWSRDDVNPDGYHLSANGKDKIYEAVMEALKKDGDEWQEE